MESEQVELVGHIIDSLTLAKVLDVILDAGAQYRIVELEVGRTNVDSSRARIEISADDASEVRTLVAALQVHGANRVPAHEAELAACDQDGVLPAAFYSTTNLPTHVLHQGAWLAVERPEMDCALVVSGDPPQARTVPMHRVRRGDMVVIGWEGVRVDAPERPRGANPFEFMASEVSSEKPKALVIATIAGRLQAAKHRGGKVLAVCGPAVVHTGAAPHVARLVRHGWIDVLFAGNGFAAHDIESQVLGTSLGVSLSEGTPTEHGHANHLRIINEVRRRGSIAAAVASGFIPAGVMYECVRRGVPFVLGGSVRDDGPLPDVYTDVVEATEVMRDHISGVAVALMLASTLHAIATGNILPAGIETYCVDINPAVATKLTDRGSHQALGVVTDVGLFLAQLADELCRPG
jgi:lysine-ketoglutarate reductase/saccharopine dehydrogenase-like protein (TIGR00300 family)